MTFKEQMEEKASEKYPIKRLDLGFEGRKGFIKGSTAALSSDLFKGLVEALELISGRCTGVEWEGMNASAAIGRIYSIAQTALTNYKQEVKQ